MNFSFFLKRILLKNRNSDSEKFKLVGPLNPRIIIAGHSHRTMLARNQINPLNLVETIAILLETEGKYIEPDSDYWEKLDENLDKKTDLVLLFRGNDSMVDFLVKDDYQVWLKLDSRINWDKDYILNRNHIYTRYSNLFKELGLDDLIDHLKLKSKRVWLHGTPPPKNDSTVMKNITIEPYFKSLFEIKGNNLELIDISTRIEIWKICQNILFEFANRHKIEFIPMPNEIIWNDTLKNEYSAPDATHYNESCGKIILENIKRVIDEASL
jgi:hypothetical protein